MSCSKINRSSHRRCSVRKDVSRNFAIFTGKHCAQFSFLIKLQAYKVTPLGDCFWINYLIIKHKVRVFPILSFVTKNDLHKQLSPACKNIIHMVPHTLHFF